MIFIALLMLFVAASTVTSALAYDQRRWHYAATITALCAVTLAAWTTNLLSSGLRHVSWQAHPVIVFVFAASPYAAVMLNLWIRRCRTPRHTPGPDDDPVLRRYLAEKRRRARQRRQTEALEAAAEDGGQSCGS
jgi:hypothetical protein